MLKIALQSKVLNSLQVLQVQVTKKKKIVVIENVFSSGLFDKSSAETCKKLEKKCLTFGKINKFFAQKNHPTGICVVHFEKLCAADRAQVCLDHELFDGRLSPIPAPLNLPKKSRTKQRKEIMSVHTPL